MSFVVERSLESGRDVVTFAESCFCHCLGRSHAAGTRSANEEQFIVLLDAERFEFAGQTLGETRIDRLIGKGLPLDKDRPLTDRPEIRGAPLCQDGRVGGRRRRTSARPCEARSSR